MTVRFEDKILGSRPSECKTEERRLTADPTSVRTERCGEEEAVVEEKRKRV